ncbi:amino acid permease-domain-containing protein [Rhypophila decipiens]|uniref:Amino acid permease-domain-containing protein n=1 Tax=Rhypophila decipiens TaxID=261697 RepID=A0AAN7B522_9PEZI|nr:amino acid permease-domain-containing protein [Rhypophila decipiens]
MEPAKVFRKDIIDLEGITPGFSHHGATGVVGGHGDSDGNSHLFVIPENRKLGVTSTTLLIVNRMIGTGIFSTPSTIMQATNSVGASLLFWVLGGFMTLWMSAYLELGTALPRSGGEKVYLERIYRKPKYLATSIFAVEIVCFAHSAANCINFSGYLLRVVHGLDPALSGNCGRSSNGQLKAPSPLAEEWINKGISMAAITLVCLVHAFTPKFGIYMSNALAFFKLIMLLLVVCTGFAALAGNLKAPRPDNFSTFDGAGVACPDVHEDSSGRAADFSLALMQVLYSYSGWENANYVLTEVRNAPETLKIAAPLANLTVTVLYILANIGYFAASSKSEIASSGTTVAASFFTNVYGQGFFVTRILPFIISLSILGNISSQTFAAARVKQEVAKEGILPFSKFFASDWPIQTPTGGLLLHWMFTVALIAGPQSSDAYPFISLLYTYCQSWVKLLIALGLLYLTLSPTSTWKAERTSFHTSNFLTVTWALSLLFVLSAPFIKNNTITPTVPWFVVPTVGCSVVVIGTIYWAYWFKIWPLFGYNIEHHVEVLPDGSERVRYVHGRNTPATKSPLWW